MPDDWLDRPCSRRVVHVALRSLASRSVRSVTRRCTVLAPGTPTAYRPERSSVRRCSVLQSAGAVLATKASRTETDEAWVTVGLRLRNLGSGLVGAALLPLGEEPLQLRGDLVAGGQWLGIGDQYRAVELAHDGVESGFQAGYQ